MKIIADVARCVGHARCAAIAPDLFELNDEGFLETPEIFSVDTLALRWD